jgi:hypothetical protein
MTLRLAPRATSSLKFPVASPVVEMVLGVEMAVALGLGVEEERNEWLALAGIEIAGIEYGIEIDEDGIEMPVPVTVLPVD